MSGLISVTPLVDFPEIYSRRKQHNYITMTNNPYTSRRRYDSPVRREGYRESRQEKTPSRYDRDYPRESEKRRHVERDTSERRIPTREDAPAVPCPPGFPIGYSWVKGDWLCPSRGCEGYVTSSKWRNCVHCGRSQPHFMILMEMAKNEKFRTEMCPDQSCRMRDCVMAHAECELRDLKNSREYKNTGVDSTAKPPVVCLCPTEQDIAGFCKRWKIIEPGVSILKRLPGILTDLVLRSFMVSPDVAESDLTNNLLKCLADIIRPQSRRITDSASFHECLVSLLKIHSQPFGLAACSNESGGLLAISLEKQVVVIRLKDFSNEDLGLLAFALTFSGLSVIHSLEDKINLTQNFPPLFCDLFDRVRLVDNPSDIVYKASDPIEEVIDRSNQARIDAVSNPAPLLPSPNHHTESVHEFTNAS